MSCLGYACLPHITRPKTLRSEDPTYRIYKKKERFGSYVNLKKNKTDENQKLVFEYENHSF
jgi:hypothetical protein